MAYFGGIWGCLGPYLGAYPEGVSGGYYPWIKGDYRIIRVSGWVPGDPKRAHFVVKYGIFMEKGSYSVTVSGRVGPLGGSCSGGPGGPPPPWIMGDYHDIGGIRRGLFPVFAIMSEGCKLSISGYRKRGHFGPPEITYFGPFWTLFGPHPQDPSGPPHGEDPPWIMVHNGNGYHPKGCMFRGVIWVGAHPEGVYSVVPKPLISVIPNHARARDVVNYHVDGEEDMVLLSTGWHTLLVSPDDP